MPEDGARGLSPEERMILDFELTWEARRGNKARAIADRFGLKVATYYRRRAALIERPEAVAYAPALINRLRRPNVP